MDTTEIRTLEEIAFTAWPALVTVLDDGWVLRLADGHTKRANSANVLWPSSQLLEQKVQRAEAFYLRHKLPPVVRLTPLVPPELDGLLATSGYRRIDESIVMQGSIGRHLADARVTISAGVPEAWLTAYCIAEGLSAQRASALRKMMARIAAEHVTASVVIDGEIAAFGLGVADRGQLGVFEILVLPKHRRQGLAQAIMCSLLEWCRARGAARAYLQVVATNAGAIELYRSLGYSEVYRYWYRTR